MPIPKHIDRQTAGANDSPLPSLDELRCIVPLAAREQNFVQRASDTIKRILTGEDPRLLVIAGPCSLSHLDAAGEYALRLTKLARELEDEMFLVLRAYIHKPRTCLGWKGFAVDPFLDGSNCTAYGLRATREFFVSLSQIGVPLAVEALDPLVHQYVEEMVSWTAIGARTTESQMHREYASGLAHAVGFKNPTSGKLQPAFDAVRAARSAHSRIAVDSSGRLTQTVTAGNPFAHIVLRGGPAPNYQPAAVQACAEELLHNALPPWVIVDCSHGNSQKEAQRQVHVFKECLRQITAGSSPIRGLMLESNIFGGAQKMHEHAAKLIPGLSLTDECLSWEDTEELLCAGAQQLRKRRLERITLDRQPLRIQPPAAQMPRLQHPDGTA
ncbi:MAG TPA: 3-deoxy-7-phosphoheptulonate synthase [Oligoflexia bacterium]|nr:3-deoxy-7-phosphoheptulonate synthase [Oligoflexia bacterium]